MENSPTRLVLIRHGEANAAVDGIVGGHRGCTGLSPLGRTQAERLRDRLARTKELTADVLLSSVLPRAVETAQVIAPALGVDAPVDQRCDLCEIHPGESDGLTWAEYRARYAVDMRADPTAPMAPGGESLVDFRERVQRALTALADEHAGRTVVVACHGGIVMGSLWAFLGVGPAHRAPVAEVWVDNTGITEWVRREDGRWRLVRHNDAAHLSDLAG